MATNHETSSSNARDTRMNARLRRKRRDALERKIVLSRWALAFERIWPRLWPPLVVVGIFLLVSLLGAWPLLPALAHKIILGLFAFALLLSFIPLVRVSWPSREQAIRRLESISGIPHRPASSYDDTLSAIRPADSSERLWRVHRERLAKLFSKLHVVWPRPRVDKHDPFALRAVLVLVTGLVAILAGDAAYDRLRDALRIAPSNAAVTARLDAWVTPPLYTGSAPMMLADGAQTLVPGTHEARRVEVPEASNLIVRAAGGDHERFSVRIRKGDSEQSQTVERAKTESASELAEFRVKLVQGSTITVARGTADVLTWRFDVVADNPPSIKLIRPPSQSARAALRLNYSVEDDYGVVSAEARLKLADKTSTEKVSQASAKLRSQIVDDLPRVLLRLPRANAKKAEAVTYKDLTSHPWAGMDVELQLVARDQAGKQGLSKPITIKLPERRFTKPFARAIVEQRRNLVLDPFKHLRVAQSLDALTIAPEEFIKDKVVYLSLRSAYWRLKKDRSPDGLRSVVDQLWQVALRIEDGDLSEAERALRSAQDKLMKALEEGASDEEIARLMQELRTALSRFLESLARQAQQGDPNNTQRVPNNRTMSSKDLDRMLRDIERMAKSGARDSAKDMLSQLREMLEQLQSGRMANNGQSNRAMEMLEQFGNLIQRQQQLLDDTFRAQQGRGGRRGEGQEGRGERQGRGRGQGGEHRSMPGIDGRGERGAGGLGNRQSELRDQLKRLLEGMRGLGAKAPNSLKGADDAMRGAERALNDDELGAATQQESLALDRLRKGAQSMAEQVMKGMTGQMGNASANRDPLGRPQGARGPDTGDSVKVPDEIDIQKARRILDELRRRLSEPTRPPIELDYLERLLERF